MAGLRRFAIIAGAAVVGIVAGDYAYFKGFDDGADAELCVAAIAVDGQKAVKTERSCRHIAGRSAPPRIFPGTNGDEPTVWGKP